MGWFSRPRRSRFPADMLRRMDIFGRYELGRMGSGIDGNGVWVEFMGQWYEYSRADPDGFLTDLRAAVADDRGGFATFGAARLVWEMFSDECVHMPAALPLVDAGIDFKLARGLTSDHLAPWEMLRLRERGL